MAPAEALPHPGLVDSVTLRICMQRRYTFLFIYLFNFYLLNPAINEVLGSKTEVYFRHYWSVQQRNFTHQGIICALVQLSKALSNLLVSAWNAGSAAVMRRRTFNRWEVTCTNTRQRRILLVYRWLKVNSLLDAGSTLFMSPFDVSPAGKSATTKPAASLSFLLYCSSEQEHHSADSGNSWGKRGWWSDCFVPYGLCAQLVSAQRRKGTSMP